MLRLVVAAVVLSACAGGGDDTLRDWHLQADGVATDVRLPGLLVGDLPLHEAAFTLRTRVAAGVDARTLVVPCFHGPLAASANGAPLVDRGDTGVGEHRYVVPATTADVELALSGRHDTVAALFGVGAAPRLLAGAQPGSGATAVFDRYLAIVELALLISVGLLFATMYYLDRRNRADAMLAIQAVVALPMVLFELGLVPAWLFMASLGAVWLVMQRFLAFEFGFERPPRTFVVLYAIEVVASVIGVASMPVALIAWAWNIAIFPFFAGWVLYVLVQRARRGDKRHEARLLLGAMVVTVSAIVVWLASSAFAGVHLETVGVFAFCIAQVLIKARHLVARQRTIEQITRERDRAHARLRGADAPPVGAAVEPSRWQRIEEVFAAACDRADAEAYVARECAGDPALAAEVLALVRASAGAGDSIAAIVGSVAGLVQRGNRGGQRVGAYRLGDLLGEGGMGVVYAAERADGEFRQRAAIKVLKQGLPADRFRDERQILATLDHPNIVRLLDGGTTEDGLPYLVMERIDGVPLTRSDGSLAQRLALVRDACVAVHHAHELGVIHRDLKPSNLLVDARGTVKLLDFGIAKLADGDREARTRTGAALMTPEYASPEQLRCEPATVASDVYALGAVLYEMIAGAPPRTGTLRELLRGDTIAWPRAPREVAAIAMTALADEPGQRYASAAALAADLARYLAAEPVRARPPGRLQRVRKRMRARPGATAAVVIATVGALGGGFAWRLWPAAAWQPVIEPVRWRDVDAAIIPDALSPDGRKLAFISTVDNDPRRLVVLDLATGTSEIVARGLYGALRWTASGDGWLYLDRRARSVRQDAHGITDLGFDTDDAADCGDTLMRLHEDLTGQWLQVRRPDGGWTTLLRLHADEVGSFPRCDPDSKRMLVNVSPTFPGICAGHALVVDRDGTARSLGDAICTATLVPGGNAVVYSASRGGRINLFERAIDGGDEHAITTGAGPDMRPDISGDGNTLAFAVEAVTATLAFGSDRLTLRGQIDQVSVTRDGERVVAQQIDDFDLQLAVVTIRHGERGPRRLAAGMLVALSDDDRRVYYRPVDHPGDIYVVSIDGGPSTLVARLPGHVLRGAEAADGLHVFVEDDHVFAGWRVPPSGPPVSDGIAGLVVPAPAGGWRAVLVPGEGMTLRLLPPDGGAARELAIQPDRIAWVDDTTLAITQTCGAFQSCPATVDVRTGVVTPLAQPIDAAFVVVAGDGKHWVSADSDGHPERAVITNFGSRPWRP